MTLNPSHQHYVAPVAEREAQSPGQHHGTPTANGPNRATELHEEFMSWLELHRPHGFMWWRKGWHIPERQWQEWHAEWMAQSERRRAPRRTLQREVKWDIRTGKDRRQT